jgi:exodeoxyribonuclease VII small subunit
MPRQESYRTLQERLDNAISLLESGNIGVDEAVDAYEDALKIIKQLENHLQTAENKVHELSKSYDVTDEAA